MNRKLQGHEDKSLKAGRCCCVLPQLAKPEACELYYRQVLDYIVISSVTENMRWFPTEKC